MLPSRPPHATGAFVLAIALSAFVATVGPGRAIGASGDGAPFRFFSPSSPWNAPLPSTAPPDPASAEFVGALYREVKRELEAEAGPAISTTSNSVPIYTVPADQPTAPVQLVSQFTVPALSSAWSSVPLPADAMPAAGNDRHLVVWQPSSDRLWEFWHLAKAGAGWEAGWGGAMQDVSSSSGVYGPAAWPGATRSWGASASSLSIVGGLITLEDLRNGRIDHALAIGLPDVRAGEYAAPAQRTDGASHKPMALPEGAHLRLDPSLELWKLNLPPLTLMLARAARRYGIFVRDGAGSVTLYAQDPGPTGADPYRGESGFFADTYPARLLASFPWKHLQLLPMQLSSTGR
jgi:hypothetical protein